MKYPGKYIEINFMYENSISINISWILHTARVPKLKWRRASPVVLNLLKSCILLILYLTIHQKT